MSIEKAIARAWIDTDYKAKLLTDPHAALAECGVDVPEGPTVKVIENTADTVHVVLPLTAAEAGKVSMDKLEEIAGGNRVPIGRY